MNKSFAIITLLLISIFTGNIHSLQSSVPEKDWSLAEEYTESESSATSYASGYGEISSTTGRPKTVHVNGYFRKDGAYVKPHYRSAPKKH